MGFSPFFGFDLSFLLIFGGNVYSSTQGFELCVQAGRCGRVAAFIQPREHVQGNKVLSDQIQNLKAEIQKLKVDMPKIKGENQTEDQELAERKPKSARNHIVSFELSYSFGANSEHLRIILREFHGFAGKF